jgi:hypothetical protein
MSVHITCGGESPESHHDRIENLKATADANRSHKARHAGVVPFIDADPLKRIAALEYTIKCFQADVLAMESDLRRLRKIEAAFEAQVHFIQQQEVEIRRLNQLLSGGAA